MSAPEPGLERPVSQVCTQAQCESEIYARWCREIREAPRLHRKQWEFCYILQVLELAGMLAPGRRGLGFGVGREPLPAVMAARGCRVVATDLATEAPGALGWKATGQHAARADNSRGICPPDLFAERVVFRPVDMNAIPEDLHGFDFCWSSCALEHLGSLERGLAFIRRSLDCLRPGGIAVHTTELSLSPDLWTLAISTARSFIGGTVFYRRRDLCRFAATLRAAGHAIALNLTPGTGPHDRAPALPTDPEAPHIHVLHVRRGWRVLSSTSVGLVIRTAG
jgi:SAM-dependent methyltransferase